MFTSISLKPKATMLAPLAVILLSLIAFFMPDAFNNSLTYDRNLIVQGEYWRVLTGHFNHSNFNHLILNLLAVVLLWSLHSDHYNNKSYALAFFYIGLICSAGIYIFNPETVRYVGLSGILHGIFVWGAIKDIQKGWRSGYLLLVGVILKVGYEQTIGASAELSELIDARVAIEAHLWGALGGAFYVAKEQMSLLKQQAKNSA